MKSKGIYEIFQKKYLEYHIHYATIHQSNTKAKNFAKFFEMMREITSEEDYEEYAEEGYEEEEDYYDEEELDDYGDLEDEATDEEPETPAVQPPKANGRGKKGTKRNKQPREGKSPFGKVKFEKIKIF